MLPPMQEPARRIGMFVVLVALYVAAGGYSTLLIESPGQVALFTGDVTSAPLLPVDGALPVVRPEPDRFHAVAADAETEQRWAARMAAVITA